MLPPLKFFDFFHGKLNRLLYSILKSNKGNYYPKMHNAYSPLTFEKRKINIYKKKKKKKKSFFFVFITNEETI